MEAATAAEIPPEFHHHHRRPSPTEIRTPKSCFQASEMQSSKTEAAKTLKGEIQHLQEELQDQFTVRHALERALSHETHIHDATYVKTIPKHAKDLIKEIATLELEVAYLEKYLLSLYRKTFDQHVSSSLTKVGESKPTSVIHETFTNSLEHNGTSKRDISLVNPITTVLARHLSDHSLEECKDFWEVKTQPACEIQRSQSSLSQHSSCSAGVICPVHSLAKDVSSYHSLPLSMLERSQRNTSTTISLAEHLGKDFYEVHISETPNWLSEELIRSIAGIYCEIAEPPLTHQYHISSPYSHSSSLNEFSHQGHGDLWSSQSNRFSSFNSHFDNPFHLESSKEFTGPYNTMVKVSSISRDNQTLKDIEYMRRKYRSLVHSLEQVNPSKMTYEEKLAFWINVHNALVMHSFLAYGIPQNKLKRMSSLQKATYNIGGYNITVEMIQNNILHCKLLYPAQWHQLLFHSKQKFKVNDARSAFTIDRAEPLLHFALCSGSDSDPAVHVYTPKRIFQELNNAKEEYLISNFSINKDKILLPKLVENYAKNSGLSAAEILETLKHIVPDSTKSRFLQLKKRKTRKSIEWVPHNFSFQYLLSNELA